MADTANPILRGDTLARSAILARIGAAGILVYFSVATLGAHGYLAATSAAVALYSMFELGRAADHRTRGEHET